MTLHLSKWFILHIQYFVADICEDIEIKERIMELKTEQEIKKQAEAKRKVRRSQSNTRTQSVRRTSLRDKGLTARRDAVEEARFRLQAESSVSIFLFLNIFGFFSFYQQ